MGATPLAGYHPIHQVWACAHLFGTLIYSICIIFSIFDGNTWSKNFQNTKLLYIFWKVWTTNTPSLNSRVVWSVHQHPPRERLHPEERNIVEHYGEDLCFEQDAVIIQKYKKKNQKSKRLAELKTWKGDLGNRECLGGLKTRKGGPGKN